MGALTDDQVKAALANTLKLTDVAKLQAYWSEIVTWANASAQAQITQLLTDNGFSTVQAMGWDNFGVYNEAIALYWCGIRGRAYVTKEQAAALKELDWRADIAQMGNLDVGGVMVFPVPAVPRVRSGSFAVPTTKRHNPLLYDPNRPYGPRLNP